MNGARRLCLCLCLFLCLCIGQSAGRTTKSLSSHRDERLCNSLRGTTLIRAGSSVRSTRASSSASTSQRPHRGLAERCSASLTGGSRRFLLAGTLVICDGTPASVRGSQAHSAPRQRRLPPSRLAAAVALSRTCPGPSHCDLCNSTASIAPVSSRCQAHPLVTASHAASA